MGLTHGLTDYAYGRTSRKRAETGALGARRLQVDDGAELDAERAVKSWHRACADRGGSGLRRRCEASARRAKSAV
jgi:hypothetical protein